MRVVMTIVVWSVVLFLDAGAPPPPLATIVGPHVVLAASPAPSTGAADTRSPGEGPGFVGAPLLAIAGVLGLGLLAAVGTIAYVRLTGGPGNEPPEDGKTAVPR